MSQASEPYARERWVSVDEVAAHLGVRKDSIYRWIENRRLPAQKLGKLWKLKLSEVDAWVRAGGGEVADDASEGSAIPAPVTAAGSDRSRTTAGRVILIVDDDEGIRGTLEDIVSGQGYGTLSAADGAQALALLQSPAQRQPSLILLDLHMPNMGGLQFLEEQKRDPRLAAIPVIVITAERRSEVPGAAMLRKPFDIAKLVAAIRGAVG